LVTGLDVDTIVGQHAYTVRYRLNGTPNLSAVAVGDRLMVTGSLNASNDGNFRITTINDSTDHIEVTNLSRIDDEDDEASDSIAVADVDTPIDFIEVTNSNRIDDIDNEASDSCAEAVIFYGGYPYKQEDLKGILEHINELCNNCGKAYIVEEEFGCPPGVNVYGCTDPVADNYDPLANSDDGSCCYNNLITVTCDGGDWQGEVGWTLLTTDGTVIATGGAPFAEDFCLIDGCYRVDMTDAYGDGWNGNVWEATDFAGVVIGSGTIDSGSFGSFLFAVGTGDCEGG